jgi:beta-N-acetylhexosaminidase
MALSHTIALEQAVGQQFLLSFSGKQDFPPELGAILARGQAGGIVLFRAKNVGTLQELRELTCSLQGTVRMAGQPPLLIAADQEGGQLMAIGQATPFPGNMALGATGSEKLANRVGRAIGRELASVGINVDFAPVCDVNNNPKNPVVGTRSFGENPKLVSRLGAAMVKGLQSAGIAATAKHFPGHGDTASDSHHAAPVLTHDLRRVRRVELPPFRGAIEAGVRLVMTAHIVFPALNAISASHVTDLPATLSKPILRGLLRRKLGFGGIIVTDAMDMNAMEQGPGYVADTLAAVAAGADLLLFNHDLARLEPAWATIVQAARRGLLSKEEIHASAARVLALKKWLGKREQPSLDVVCCREHRALAAEVARKSMTLVRDDERQLPLQFAPDARIAVVVPRPADLTPADTSSYLIPQLAVAVRRHHGNVDEFLIPMNPDEAEVRAFSEQLSGYDLVIIGTINANEARGQAALVNAMMERRTCVVAVAMRMPSDISAYPSVPAYACTYSILQPSMDAVADALWGKADFPGQSPVTL